MRNISKHRRHRPTFTLPPFIIHGKSLSVFVTPRSEAIEKGREIGVYLFHLELDGGLQFVTLLIDVVSVGEERREFSGLVETRTQEPWNLLNKRLGSQKGVVFLGELLNKLFLLVQLFQVISAHERVAFVFSLIAMLLISKDTHREFGPWNVAQPMKKHA